MPISKYYHGHGSEVMSNMVKEYGAKKGKQVFYAKANKSGQNPKVHGELEKDQEFASIRNKVLNFDPKMKAERGSHTHEAPMEKERESQGSLSKKFTSEYLMGSTQSSHPDHQPVTTGDKVMSDEHKRRRREIDQISSHVTRMKESIKYNKLHMNEHAKALKTATKTLKDHEAGKLCCKYLDMKGY